MRARLNSQSRPAALGRIEHLACELAGLQQTERPRATTVPIIIFAGDHGVVAQGVSAYPQEVTIAMMSNFAGGGAAISVLARELGSKPRGGGRRNPRTSADSRHHHRQAASRQPRLQQGSCADARRRRLRPRMRETCRFARWRGGYPDLRRDGNRQYHGFCGDCVGASWAERRTNRRQWDRRRRQGARAESECDRSGAHASRTQAEGCFR